MEFKDMRVLVVDDMQTMRNTVKRALRRIGISNTEEADEGKTALRMMKSEKFDLVMCDLNMPGMSGLELLKAVRADEDLRDIPFVLVTAEDSKENVQAAVKAGVSNYVVKPFTTETMEQKLKKVFPD